MQFRLSSLYLKTIFIIVVIFFSSPFKLEAASSASILVNMVPENPSPGEDTVINLDSYVNNLDGVSISWSVNGETVLSGTGKKSLSVTAPAAGEETIVIATVSLVDGAIDTKIIIKPAVLVLLWQAEDSYVPPFYKGKALPTADSSIKVVAMPEVKIGSKIIDSKNMVYAWKKDYTNNPDGSGYGKNFFVYNSEYLDDSNNISVKVSTPEQNYSSEKSIDIATFQPKIVFYKNDITLGTLWEQALTNEHAIVGNEILEAAPYFASPADIRIPTLIFDWFINDEKIAVDSLQKNLMPVSVQEGVSGTSTIKVKLSNTYKIFENASKEININF